jgi:drug/metabolite transporter (DMT)-like permease
MPAHHKVSTPALARDVVVLGLVWGGSVVLQRFAVGEIAPLPLLTLRLITALVFFLPFLPRIRRGLAGSPRRLLDLTIIGAQNPFITGIGSAIALQFASSGLVGVLGSLGPLFSALLAKLVLQEPPLTRAQVAGLGAALGGVVLLIATGSTGLDVQGDLRGHALALGIALVMATCTVYSRLRLGGTDPLAAAAGQIGGAFVLAVPALLIWSEPVDLGAISLEAWLAVVLSGGVGLSASFILFLGMIERHGPTAALLALYVMPVAATALGALFLGETVTLAMSAGAGLVLAGVVMFTKKT